MSSSEGSLSKYAPDEEKGPNVASRGPVANITEVDDGVPRTAGPLAKLWSVVLWLDSFGVEAQGVERVHEDARHHTSLMDAGFLWCSANTTIATFSLGTLSASIYGLGLTDAALVILFFNLLCTIPVALFSTFGMQSGLRQMIIGRYSFGVIGIYGPIILNCIACVGWTTINQIVGSQALNAVAHDSDLSPLPIWAGILIIALVTMFIACFGYRFVHHFERWASLPVFIIFVILLGQTAPHMMASMSPPGEATAASVVSYGATIAGFALGWTSLAADYTVNFPANSSKARVFAFTYIGLNLPLIFIETLGAAVMTTFANKTTWEDAYHESELGGLLGAPLIGPMGGFGRFLLVVLGLSIVANNIPNLYSFALTFQAFGRYAQAIPRFFLVMVGAGISIPLSIVGASSFESVLDSLLLLLAYWLAIWSTILIEEHYIFRRGSFKNYDLESYNTLSKLPKGYAAIGAACVGIAGAVLGMSQQWYTGVIARLIGPMGCDIGFELSAAFSGVTYPVLRYLEYKYIGR